MSTWTPAPRRAVASRRLRVRCGEPRAEYEGLSRSLWGLLRSRRLDATAAARAKGLMCYREHGVGVTVCTPHFWGEVWNEDDDRRAAIRSTVTEAGAVFAYDPRTHDLRLIERRDWPDDLVRAFQEITD